MDEILGYFIEEPRRLTAIGRTAFTVGMLVVVIGLVGLVAKTGVSAVHSLGKAAAAAAQTRDQLYPDLRHRTDSFDQLNEIKPQT